MERDASNLERTAVDGRIRIELYRFLQPSVTAGRFARVEESEVENWRARGHEFARRPTGGGILRHEGDICFGAAWPRAGVGASDDIGRAAQAVREALAEQGIITGLPEPGPARAPNRCFERAVGPELLFRGEKILGLAARKIRGAVLVQGSLSVERHPGRDREILGAGPLVDLAGTGFDAESYAKAMRGLLGTRFA